MTVEEFQKKFGIIGKSKQIKDLVDITMQIAGSDISVLISGESGTGKEVFARAIHGYSSRAQKRLVGVNCGAIPEGLLESELFGHKKGSFTGALDDRKGYFEIADGGSLFLDEIAEMPLTTQVKLLRALETKEFMRIGSETVTKVDIRIIAASNKDLQREVESKRFRSDLFFRLKAVSLTIPPIRERREDIFDLITHFTNSFCGENGIPIPKIEKEAYNLLTNYDWPGNIREMKNVMETAVALNKDGVLTEDTFLPLLADLHIQDEEAKYLPIHLNKSPEALDREMIYRALIEIKKDLIELKHAFNQKNGKFVSPAGQEEDFGITEIIPLEKVEKEAIIKALAYTKNNKRKAAGLLNISERTLYRKIEEYGID
jgi:transcriptional regulator with PAS, ATPase and Fis domain